MGTSNTYGATPPNITVLIEFPLPDGSMGSRPREGVILSNPNQRIFSNDHPSAAFPDPNGMVFETIYTNNKNIHYVWVESRSENPPKRLMKKVSKKLAPMGIDMSRFWKVGMEFC